MCECPHDALLIRLLRPHWEVVWAACGQISFYQCVWECVLGYTEDRPLKWCNWKYYSLALSTMLEKARSEIETKYPESLKFNKNSITLAFPLAFSSYDSSSSSLENPDCVNIIVFILKDELLDTRRLLLHCNVHSQCLCSGGFTFPHHTCYLHTGPPLATKLRCLKILRASVTKIYGENKLCTYIILHSGHHTSQSRSNTNNTFLSL